MVTEAQHAEVKKVAAQAALEAAEALALAKKTYDMVADIHRALIDPQVGYDKGLMDRMATVTMAYERGAATGDTLIRWAKILGAISAISAALWTFFHFGQAPK